MKKIFHFLFLITPTVLVFSQMSNNGYADLKLGMTIEEAKKVVAFKTKDDIATINFDEKKLELTFTKNGSNTVLWTVSTTDPKTKIIDFDQELIGKDYETIKKLLGDKLVAADFSEVEDEYFIYHNTPESEENYDTSCVLQFDEKKILKTIFASYNP